MRALVLGGGGARGALQVGALRALFEAGYQPQLIVGTSVGAVNATYLAARACSVEGLAGLENAWRATVEADLLPANYVWVTLRSLFRRGGTGLGKRMRDFFIDQGLDPELRFGQLEAARLILVATDLNGCCGVLFGDDPEQPVLDALLASTAIPPWVEPQHHGDRLLADGGIVSSLPIEPALRSGATEIVAIDVSDRRNEAPVTHGPGPFLFRMLSTMEHRQVETELQLAAAHGVPVHHVPLQSETPVQVWQFDQADALFAEGYALARKYLAEHPDFAALPAPDLIEATQPRRLWDRIRELPPLSRLRSLQTLHRLINPRQA